MMRLLLICALAVGCAGAGAAQQQTTPAAPAKPTPAQKTAKKTIDPDATAGVRGSGVPVVIEVRSHGKAVAGALVEVRTDSGVLVSKGQTDSSGKLKAKLDEGDYSISASVGERDKTITAKVAAAANGAAINITVTM